MRLKQTEYNWKEVDRRLKEQFINGINGQSMLTEIKRESTIPKDKSEVTVKQVLIWIKIIKVKWPSKSYIWKFKNTKEFDMIRKPKQKNPPQNNTMAKIVQNLQSKTAHSLDIIIHQDNAQHTGKCVTAVRKRTTSEV